MKLIIDIPKGTYEAVKVGIINQVLEYKVWNAIKDGTPLDDVKTEIAGMEYHMIDCDVLVSQEDVLDILDNIGKDKNNC